MADALTGRQNLRATLTTSRLASVAQVAELVGYSDARAYRRAFKRWAGVLPNEFRGALG